jgi:tetratricopeptide (TPR) repeat protein
MTSPAKAVSRFRHALSAIVSLSGFTAVLLASAPVGATAGEEAEVSRLIAAGNLSEAMAKVDAAVARRPNDPRMRFSKGMILARQNKTPEAIAVLSKLTQDFPELPEPYNNLAVLYASQGQYEKARSALDKAIQINPGYTTAYENLGDVYAELAIQAYEKVTKLDAGSQSTRAKLAVARNVTGNVQTVSSQKSLPASAEAAPGGAGLVPPAMQPTKSVTAPAGNNTASNANTESAQILAAVDSWAQAWSARDVKRYLNFYSDDFQTPAGQSREAWKAMRTARITDKSRIEVKVESPQVAVSGDTATVNFRQTFVSDRLTAKNPKTLVLVKRAGTWQIKQERTTG